MTPHRGFTLIELSIVLVVIGLVTGGILFGRDLIEAARFRQQISQIEQFKVAVSTFRNKYGGIPGDLKADVAASFGMSARSGDEGDGDGDGLITACGAEPETFFGCETILFWNDLSFAELIPGSFTMPSTGVWINVYADDFDKYLPVARLAAQLHFMAYTLTFYYPALNYLPTCHDSVCLSLVQVIYIDSMGGIGAGFPETGVPPLTAFAIDNKMDDGKPFGGIVNSGLTFGTPVITDPSFYGTDPQYHKCLTMAGTGSSPEDFAYVVSGPYADQPECGMNFRAL